MLVSVAALTAAPLPGMAQSQLPRPSQLPPPGGNQPTPRQQAPQSPAPQAQPSPAPAAAKPYKPVAVRPPAPLNDPSLEAFRKQLAGVAERKDRAALARLIVPQGFFWLRENGDAADKRKSGIDNLAKAIGLDSADAGGWDMLQSYTSDPTGGPLPDHQGVICAPADPSFDENALEQLVQATQTDISEWGYPMSPGVEVRGAPQPNAPVIDKLGMNFVRVVPADVPENADQQQALLQIVTPSGKTGYVPMESIAPLGSDQLCYVKDGSGWKIGGYIGGEPAQQ
ncbi:MAG TPA: hypothetical protein VHA77_12415 [Xanthobacteraceae bacterium]|nr:hypothetical protein [Xanthobacteraceae bacterium]